ncbi:hypothetical protein SCHPADRAFT_379263 [Schizopora paradoxa]|uniref:DUF6534 domain-containing protein n=1 Tax=Schizopora paradoxa TaxID=27342 RepID=A0A0H2RUL5_9AGAM|nr:hypothetical protein SCHPADRAFT_379263 [Schizopora paradoxa]
MRYHIAVLVFAKETDTVIDKLLLYMINAGFLTVIYNSFVLTCIVTMKTNFIYAGALFLVSKLYTNSLLAVVNSRQGFLRESENGSFALNEGDEPHSHEPDILSSFHVRRRVGFRSSVQLSKVSSTDVGEIVQSEEHAMQKHPVDLEGFTDTTNMPLELKVLPLEG